MDTFQSETELATLFKIPFERKKIIHSLSSNFFHNSNIACKIGEKQITIDIDEEDLLHNPLPEFPCGEHGCRVTFTNVHDYEIHYLSSHSIICTECRKTFPSYNLLDAHIQERHDTYLSTAQQKNVPVFNCLVDGCALMFSSLEARNEHAITVHNYPPNFKFQQLKTFKTEKMDVTSGDEDLASFSSKNPKAVPKRICFGRGSTRAFTRKKTKSKTTDITMKELADAL